MRDPSLAAVFAIDGGNSKAEALLVGDDGRVMAAVRSGTVSHQQVGWSRAAAGIDALARTAADNAGLASGEPIARIGSYCLAGADFPTEIRRLRRAILALRLAPRTVIRNDTLAALRAGSKRGVGVALICGQGINGIAVSPNGRTARFDALGDISGDWGGGSSVGAAGLAAAVRAGDGRGPSTTLRERIPEHFGLPSVRSLVKALYTGRIDHSRLSELSLVVFQAAADGDAVARGIIDRLAVELATMAVALLRRTGQLRLDVDVVLAGGILRAGHRSLIDGVMERVRRSAPHARPRILDAPPVLGAALLGLDEVALSPALALAAERRLRAEIAETTFRSPSPGGGSERR